MGDVQIQLGEAEAVMAAEVLKALGHPVRLRVVACLTGGEVHVSGLAEQLNVSQAIISQQLRILRSAGLVAARTESGHAYYRITEPHLFQMLQCISGCVTSRGDR